MIRIVILFFLISFHTFGQSEKQNSKSFKLTETDSLYYIAIEKYTVEIDSFYNKYSNYKQPKIIFIEYQDYLMKIPDIINGYEIKKIGIGNRKKVFRNNGNKLRYVKIFPLSISDGQFDITLIPYFAELKRGKFLHLSLSDWTKVFFELKNGQLIYVKTENGGI